MELPTIDLNNDDDYDGDNNKSAKKSIRILICSANLGNAKPDEESLDAWVPLDGLCRFVVPPMGVKPEFPIVMDPRRAKNPPLPPTAVDTTTMTGTTTDIMNNNEDNYLTGTSSAQNSQGDLSVDIDIPPPNTTPGKRSRTASEEINFLEFEKMFGEREPAPAPAPLSPKATVPKEVPTVESIAANFPDWSDHKNSSGTDEINDRKDLMKKIRSRRGSAIAEEDDDDPSNSSHIMASPIPPKATRNLEELDGAFQKANLGTLEESDIPKTIGINIMDKDRRSSSGSLPGGVGGDESRFDIIVIGMQEATFSMEDELQKLRKQQQQEQEEMEQPSKDALSTADSAEISGTRSDGNTTDDGDLESLSSSSSEEDELEADEGKGADDNNNDNKKKLNRTLSSGSVQNDDGNTATTSTMSNSITSDGESLTAKIVKKSKVKALGGALTKLGKVATKQTMNIVKVTNKVTKVTAKNAKAAKTLVTARDNTARATPSPQDTSNLEEEMYQWSDTVVLHYMFEDQLPSYKRALSYQLGEMRMIIYYKESAIDLDLLSVKSQTTGKHGLANKGGIVAEVAVNKTTRLGFFSAHLEAHEGANHCANRCSSFYDIFRGTRSSQTPFRYDASVASHFMFVMGDLNFRTKLYPGYGYGTEKHINMCHSLAETKNWMVLNKYDELAKSLREKQCLLGFATPYCNFDPTFKVARKFGYEYNPKRSPSYTDRILFKTTEQLQPSLRPLIYEPIRAFTTSDHKPIRGAFDIKLNDPLILDGSDSTSTAAPSGKEKNGQGRLHFLVSAMRCQLDKELYDKRMGTEREMPDPYISFVSTPPEALRMEAAKPASSKKKGFLPVGSSSGSSSTTRRKFPGTSIVAEAFKPNWKGEQLYFKLQTHNSEDGSPIDLTGALLHVSVFDKKGTEPRLLGAITFNLAKLIENARAGGVLSRGGNVPGRVMSGAAGRGAQKQPSANGRGMPNQGPSGRGRGMQDQGPSGRGRGMQDQGQSGRGRGMIDQGSSGRGGSRPQRQVSNEGRGGIAPVRINSAAGRGGPTPQNSSTGMGMPSPMMSPGGRKATVGGRLKAREAVLTPAQRSASPGALRGQRSASPGPLRGQRSASPGPLRGQRSASPGPLRQHRAASPVRAASSRGRSPSPVPVRNRSRAQIGMGTWIPGKPSMALLGASQREGMPEAVVKASKIMAKKTKAREQGNAGAAASYRPDFNVLSIHLSEEPLLDGAREVGRITLSLDVWWMDDKELTVLSEPTLL